MMQRQGAFGVNALKHQYASWCAASAYGRGLAGGGNKLAFDLIEVAGLGDVTSPDDIGDDVDAWQLGFMRKMMIEVQHRGRLNFAFGHAQKLVNIYLKTTLVCGGHHEHSKVQKLHPPLDYELFKGLRTYLWRRRQALGSARQAFLAAQATNPRWTSFTEADYLAHIAAIKQIMTGRPLYLVEEHWNL
ncbi:hypothetical protein [Pseudomonas aeruginosa]|uniref:hypothetical protein n=1 Tax=Pseudomonas aeruginosa TaxID=287 RepID=UPI000EB5EF9D|nr:hypothetical protein [Pseudomonas aeruginosa]